MVTNSVKWGMFYSYFYNVFVILSDIYYTKEDCVENRS
jgi:hypothetical protein